MLDPVREIIREGINFLTDPEGWGFPILIGAGLGAILILMKYNAKSEAISKIRLEEKEKKRSDINLPQKPF